jgi:DNA repair exonuclease SbcCD nuclease subunit
MNIEQIFLISDLHFGFKNSNLEWLDIQKDYFKNFFIPLIKENKTKNSVLMVLGDIFDHRTHLNLQVMNDSIEIFERLSKIIPIYIITGNHDIYYKSSNLVNSLKPFKYISNIQVFEELETLELSNSKSLVLMPWINNPIEEKEVILNNKADYLFAHTEFKGYHQTMTSIVNEGMDIETFKHYKKVFSGHIHLHQVYKNFTLIGSPYAMSRADVGNKKGIYILNTNNFKQEFIENDYSPEFKKLLLKDILNISIEKFKGIIKNNFVDIVSDSSDLLSLIFNKISEMSLDCKRLEPILLNEYDINIQDFDNVVDKNYSDFNIIDLSESFINELPYNQKKKSDLKEIINDLYLKVKESE